MQHSYVLFIVGSLLRLNGVASKWPTGACTTPVLLVASTQYPLTFALVG